MATATSKESVNGTYEGAKPPFLRRVRIRGYKSIAFCDVPLQPLTILVGRNGAGKSNFLDALAFLRDVMKVGVAEAVNIRPRGGWPSVVCRSTGVPKVEIEIEASFDSDMSSWLVSESEAPSSPLFRVSDPLGASNGSSCTATYRLEFSAAPHSAPVISREYLMIAEEAGPQVGGFEVIDGVAHWLAPPDPSQVNSLPRRLKLFTVPRPDFPLISVIGMQPVIDLGEGLRSMAFYNFIPDAIRTRTFPTAGQLLDKHGQNLASVIEGLKELEPESIRRVRDYLAVIAREIEDFTVDRHGESETVRFRLRGQAGEKSVEFDASSMSDGTLRALATLMAAFQVVLPHGYPSVVGIEEPETALHPAAMRALVDALDDATQRTQVILTTHSADLLSGRDVSPGQVLVVRNRGGQTHITPVDPASREIIEKELYSLDELQRMDKLDLDEGDLDRQNRLSLQGGV